MTLDIIFITGQTLALDIKSVIKNKDGLYTLILADDSKYTFNPQNSLIWGIRRDSPDDKAKKSSTLSS